MDPRTFDRMIQWLSQTRSRRSLVCGSLGAAVLAALSLGDEAQTKKKGRKDGTAKAEACIATGKRCPAPKPRGRTGPNRKPKTLGCDQCCQDFSVAYTNQKGKTVRKCDCKPLGQPSTTNQQWQCCSGLSGGSQCVSSPGTTEAVGPPAQPPPPAPTCTDVIQNGNETDIDCGGGTCPRCGYSARCATRHNCIGALCFERRCEECGPVGTVGGCEAGCICDQSAATGRRVCDQLAGSGQVEACTDCGPGETCVALATTPPSFGCYPRC